MIKGERPLSKLGIKESFLNSLKGIYKYLIANMALNGKILKAKYLKLGKRWRSLVLILLIQLYRLYLMKLKRKEIKDITKDINEGNLESCHYLQMIVYVEKFETIKLKS